MILKNPLINIPPPDSPYVTETSSFINEFLEELRDTLSWSLTECSDHKTILLFVIHDILSHIVSGDFVLPQYGTSLGSVLYEKIDDTLDVDKNYFKVIIQSDTSLKVLLYRYYLVKYAFSRDIDIHKDYTPLYILIGSMYYKKVRFSPVVDLSFLKHRDKSKPVVNEFRSVKTQFESVITKIINQDAYTEFATDIGNSCLSSVSIMYILYYVYSVIDFENRVRPNDTYTKVLDHILKTSCNIEGVLLHA